LRFRLSNFATTLCSLAAITALVYLFYASALRERVESTLSDLRTRWAPGLVPSAPVVVITIDQASIAALNLQAPLQPWERANQAKSTDLSPEALLKVIRALAQTQARAIAVLLPRQVYNYDDPALDQITALAQQDARVILGTFDQSQLDSEVRSPNRLLLTGAERLAKADVKRNFRRGIIRQLTIRQDREMPYLLDLIYRDVMQRPFAAEAPPGDLQIELNYAYLGQIAQISAETVVKGLGAFDLRGAILLVGYTEYRPFTLDNREATFVNTPWQAEGDDVSQGKPLVLVLATGLINMLEGSWLEPAPLLIVWLETALFACLAFAAWRLSIGIACLLFLVGGALLLVAHAYIFAYLHIHVPLADTLLWSALATYAGAVIRLRAEGRWRTSEMAKLKSDREVVTAQDRFLSRFTTELAAINDLVTALLHGMTPQLHATAVQATLAHARALSSSEELRDYLAGMGQVAFLTQTNAALPKLRRLDLDEPVQAVIRQLDQKAQDAKVRFKIVYKGEATALADATLVTQILYNLVANAVQYSPPGSEVIIAAIRHKSEVQLRVTDQGVGIAAEHQDRIFEKFYRVKSDFVYKSKGHGLGLYLSRYFARRMGADISTQSVPGLGSTFTLHLRPGK